AIRPIVYKNRKSFLMTCEDISEARILSEHLEYQAKYDSLTGLINRSEFERRLRQLLMHTPENTEHALCYLDLDQFKVINDTCGHLAGDEMLRRLGALLTTVVRKRDTLARLGGDEFAVLLEHCPFYKAREIAENLLDTIKTFRFEWQGKHFSLGVSIGLVPVGRESGTLSDILSTADSACYAAKDAGRNRVHIYNVEDDELSMRRSEMQWVAEITNALEENRFQLAVQPIVSLQNTCDPEPDGSHYEILIRMEDKDGNLVMPGSFLPAAEKYNLSGRLDQWVVDHIFTWLNEHPQELEALQLCSINLSGLSMSNPQFMNYLVNKFDAESAIAKKICLEVTETAAITHLGDAIKFMNLMKEIGCSFSLDDFGTGLSSFGYLKNLPVDYLKIDGSFIRNIAQDATDQAMVRSINEIGQVMGKATIAEFVENDQIRDILKKIGVNYAQGYGIGRPVLLRDVKK
ncbi:MAG: EAL domain-containing protein, partial [Gammaproteobacteria bacterium]